MENNLKNYEKDFMPGEVVVGLKSRNLRKRPIELFPEVEIAEIEDLYEPLLVYWDPAYKYDPSYEVANKKSLEKIRKVKRDGQRKKAKEEKLDKLRKKARTVFVLKLSSKSKENVLDAIELLKKNPMVAYAEPNYISHPCVFPNDSEYRRLWGMNKIQAPQAWDISIGNNSVNIGVLDSGFRYYHPDLEANMNESRAVGNLLIMGVDGTIIPIDWRAATNAGVEYAVTTEGVITSGTVLIPARAINSGSNGNVAAGAITTIINPTNGVISVTNPNEFNGGSGNGYNAQTQSTHDMDDYDIDDFDGHGTHVAGTVGGMGDNSTGVAGVSWDVTMVPIRISQSNTNSDTTATNQTRAIRHATFLDLPVISMSYATDNAALNTDFNDAVDNYDGLIILSAGNNSQDIDDRRGVLHRFGNVIFVAAIDNNREESIRASSNFGVNTVDISAPGENIYSTDINAGGYSNKSGTSMATPHVAGTAALLLSVNPGLITAELRSALLDNADIIPALQGFVNGSRRLNVYKSMLSVLPIITIDNLEYNGASAFDAISISAIGAFKEGDLHVVINKYNDSDTITETASSSVSISSLEIGTYEPPSTVNSLNSSEHIGIFVYKDNTQQNLLTRHFVHPAVFTFN